MNQNQLEVQLLEEVENTLGFILESKQLEFIFNRNDRLICVSPRRYGKDTMMYVRLLIKSLSKPGKSFGVVGYNTMSIKMMFNKLIELFNRLGDFIESTNLHQYRIQLKNNAVIQFLSGKTPSSFHGKLFDELFIMEAYSYTNHDFKDIVCLGLLSITQSIEPQIVLLGTPGAGCFEEFHRLCFSSPLWSRLIITCEDTDRLALPDIGERYLNELMI